MTAREQQKQRTRQALIDAYLTMVRDGGESPTVQQVAEKAGISVATAYRYFPNPKSLRDDGSTFATRDFPTFEEVLADAGDDPLVRVELLIRTITGLQFADEPVWRSVFQMTQERWFAQWEAGGEMVPVRSTARRDGVELALRPLAGELPKKDFARLVNAVMLVWGVEAVIATRDAVGLEPGEALDTMVWAAQALIQAARKQQEGPA
ncbi:TetR/AcrR family transcriptional regulator [Kribbella koreensis]|uniref:TetR/AcrR family transcriptional regulator n=2 Tax=Kribbella TaxID=182639 RepID=A0ABP6Z4I9_9ACTN